MNADELQTAGYRVGETRVGLTELLANILFNNEIALIRVAVGIRLMARELERETKDNCRLRALLAFTEHRLAETLCPAG